MDTFKKKLSVPYNRYMTFNNISIFIFNQNSKIYLNLVYLNKTLEKH